MPGSIRKDRTYGDFSPIGRKADGSGGFRYRCRCGGCGAVRDFAESTLRRKPSCARCRKAGERTSVESGELPENVAEQLATFRADSPELLSMLEALDDSPGAAFGASAIRMLMGLIPEAEAAYRMRPSQSLAYALNSFISNIRELQQDLEEKAERADMAGDIMTRLMQPKFHEIARILADSHYTTESLVLPYIDKRRRKRLRRELRGVTRDVGSKLESVYSEIEKGLLGRMQ